MYNEYAAARTYEFRRMADASQLRGLALATIAERRAPEVAPLEAATLVKPRNTENPFDIAQASRLA